MTNGNRKTSAQFGIKPRVYVERSAMYENVAFCWRNWRKKIISEAYGFSSVKIHYYYDLSTIKMHLFISIVTLRSQESTLCYSIFSMAPV